MQPDPVSRRYNRAPAQTLQALHIPEALLKIQTVIAVTGLSESTIRRKVAEGKFPAPIKLGARTSRWPAATIDAWIQKQIDAQGAA